MPDKLDDQQKLLQEIQKNLSEIERQEMLDKAAESTAFAAASKISKDALISDFLDSAKIWSIEDGMAATDSFFNGGDQDEDEDQGKSLWLISFTDIIALMLTFFVLLYSMSVPQQKQWENMVQSLDRVVVPHKTLRDYSGGSDHISIKKIDTQMALDLNYLVNILRTQLQGRVSLDEVYLFTGSDRMIVSLPSSLAFAPGQEQMNAEGLKILATMSEVFSRINNRIEVVGHADPSPVSNDAYINNWELSLRRAMNVAAFLKQAGYSRDMVVRGASDSRFELSNQDDISPELQKAMARRVDIVVMRDNGKPYIFAPGLDF